MIGFYHTVYFSRQFGDSLVAEPVVEFVNEAEARYTLRQRTLSGAWKDLLFAGRVAAGNGYLASWVARSSPANQFYCSDEH